MVTYDQLRDPQFFKENVLPAHSDHICYSSLEAMERGENSFRLLLNGLWKFSYAPNLGKAVDGFEKPEIDCHGWADIPVPAHIQMEGYDQPQYVNVQYPWDGHEDIWIDDVPTRFNPVASYVKYFTVPEDWAGRPVCISFQGVESGMAVWLNGHYVGYSEDSFTPSDFELTPYLQPGENKLAVRVYKWTSGSWTEDQDMFRFSGIFRDVYLYTYPDVHIQDLKIVPELDGTYENGSLIIEASGAGSGSVRVELRECVTRAVDFPAIMELGNRPSGQGQAILLDSFDLQNGRGTFTAELGKVKLWSAEEPNLYELVLSVQDTDGTVTETICEAVGFRRFEMRDGLMCLNGKRIVFRGVNRHEFSSRAGRVPQPEEILLDVLTMKRNNINAIRTSHYPNDSRIYRLCDRLGLYMIGENNMEAHGTGAAGLGHTLPGDNTAWRDMMLDRVNSTYQRDKNHPAILIWSCGNESYGGSVIRDMADKFRELDSKRLVHYEGIFWDRQYPSSSDMESQMYTPVADIQRFLAENPGKPFICCEYSHAMGNSCGAMHKYTDLSDTEPRYQGGFIWDYVDQSIAKKDRYGVTFQAYGGDFGDRPTDFNFSGNGIVYGNDRSPSPKMQEVKFNYQSITAQVTETSVTIHNKNLFIGTDRFTCKVKIARNGELTQTFILSTEVAPLSEKIYPLPVWDHSIPGEYTVTVSFELKEDTIWGKQGHEIAYGQGVFQIGEAQVAVSAEKPQIIRGKWNLGVRGERFEMLFAYEKGGLVSYRYDGRELLASIPMPNFWRAPVDNDVGYNMMAHYGQWKLASLYLSDKDPENNCAPAPAIEEGDTWVSVTYRYHFPVKPGYCDVTYRVFGDGTVETTMTYEPIAGMGDMPEFGMMMKLSADYDHLKWYGLGPEETYADRCHAKLGIYQNRVADNMARYLVPQECGNKVGIRWAEVTDENGHGLRFEGEDLSFSALPYTPHELENARHPFELPQIHYTVIRVAMQQMGIGGDNTWGARPHPEYLLPADQPLKFTYRFKGI